VAWTDDIPERTFVDSRGAHLADHNRLYAVHNTVKTIPAPLSTSSATTAKLKDAIEAAARGILGGTVELGAGDFLLDDTIEVRSKWGLRIVGQGMATRLVWKGAADKPMFRFAHARQSGLENMTLNFDTDGYAGIHLLRDNAPGSLGIPTYCRFVNLVVNCANRAPYGIAIGGVGNVDANNDFHYFEHCEVNEYALAAWVLRGDGASSQSYNNMMTNCRAYAGTTGQYAVEAGGTFPGSFAWRGGFTNANQVADFNLGRSYSPHIVEFVNSENSKRFILMDSTPHYTQAIVRGCRWSGAQIHEDMQAIIVDGATKQLVLEGNSIGDGGTDQAVQLAFRNGAIVSMRLNRVYSSVEAVFSSGVPGELFGNLKITNEGTLATVALTA
jgi:hypothetical protein